MNIAGIAWAPHSSCHICTAGDDHQVIMMMIMTVMMVIFNNKSFPEKRAFMSFWFG